MQTSQYLDLNPLEKLLFCSQIGDGQIVCLIDEKPSSLEKALLCIEALGAKRVIPLYIDTGLVLESRTIIDLLKKGRLPHLHVINAAPYFSKALEGINEEEEQQQIIESLLDHLLKNEVAALEVRERPTFVLKSF